jgi:hypothetical protein
LSSLFPCTWSLCTSFVVAVSNTFVCSERIESLFAGCRVPSRMLGVGSFREPSLWCCIKTTGTKCGRLSACQIAHVTLSFRRLSRWVELLGHKDLAVVLSSDILCPRSTWSSFSLSPLAPYSGWTAGRQKWSPNLSLPSNSPTRSHEDAPPMHLFNYKTAIDCSHLICPIFDLLKNNLWTHSVHQSMGCIT